MPTPLQFTGYLCSKCGWTDFHPAGWCPRCASVLTESVFQGEGKIVTHTTIRYPPKGFETQAPYVVAIIDIEKGPRVIGRVLNSGNEVKIGDAVSLTSVKEGTLEFQLGN